VPRRQNTVGSVVEIAGKALFAGNEVKLRLCPAEPGTGILFIRTDLPDKPVVPATTDNLGDGFQCTVLRQNDVEIRSTEHLLSACMGLRVDNLVVEIDGPELPSSGGCATAFAEALLRGGIEEQNADKPEFEIKEAFVVSDSNGSISGLPAEEGLTLSYVFEAERVKAPSQVVTFRLDPQRYTTEMAPARTFADESAYDEFKKRGLGGGVTDENALVIFQDGSVRTALSRNVAELRFADEFARHKLLDLLGDLCLAGVDIKGRVVAVRSGHRLNGVFASRLHGMAFERKAPEEYLDIREIQRILPHRYPFLLVDRILRVEEDNKIVGLKNVSINEHFFQGHYPDYPIMPGVLQIEALAQVAGVLLLRKLEHTGKVALMVGIDSVKLRKAVLPGDQLILEAEAVRVRSRTAHVNTRATVNGEVACEAEIKFMLVEPDVM
jgi:UDP-3-O-[3-hydroxymyristoyl] N-acetylglucosamine deacetylase/3-hydroxyacyl-[acyl-carrier-protein] dehydratase